MAGTDCIYLNNVATSCPKPPEILNVLQHSFRPSLTRGRRGAIRNSKDKIGSARSIIGDLSGNSDNKLVIFSHTHTDILNTLIQGFCSAHIEYIHIKTSARDQKVCMDVAFKLEFVPTITI